MSAKALIFASGNGSALRELSESCARAGLDVEKRPDTPSEDALRAALPDGPLALFLPALEEDFQGVKLAQVAQATRAPRVVALYAAASPSAEYLRLALNEGVDAVITLDSRPESMAANVQRMARRLRERQTLCGEDSQVHRELETLTRRCESLEHAAARWRERILALSATSIRLATGELRIAEEGPSLLIAASSVAQAASAKEIAERLGFRSRLCSSAAQALEALAAEPPNVILTDGALPDMDARAFAQSARRVMAGQPVVVIVWSSNRDAEDALMAPESGLDDFVPKGATAEGRALLAAALLGGLR